MRFEHVKTLLYMDEEGPVSIDMLIDCKNQSMWTTQEKMAEMFEEEENTIEKHLNTIFKDDELVKEEVTFNPNKPTNDMTCSDSKNQPMLYELDAVISLGYRVKTKKGIYFRRWATRILSDYIIKGFALDEELLKNNYIKNIPVADSGCLSEDLIHG